MAVEEKRTSNMSSSSTAENATKSGTTTERTPVMQAPGQLGFGKPRWKRYSIFVFVAATTTIVCCIGIPFSIR